MVLFAEINAEPGAEKAKDRESQTVLSEARLSGGGVQDADLPRAPSLMEEAPANQCEPSTGVKPDPLIRDSIEKAASLEVDEKERSRLIDGVTALGSKAVPELLTLAAEEQRDDWERSLAVHIVGKIGDRGAIPQLEQLYESAAPGLKTGVAKSLAALGQDNRLHQLIADNVRALGESQGETRGFAPAQSQLFMIGKDAVPAVAAALSDQGRSLEARRQAAEVLGFVGDARGADALAQAAAAKDPLLRFEAGRALIALKDERGIEPLRKLAEDPEIEQNLRRPARRILNDFALEKDPQGAVAELLKIGNQSDIVAKLESMAREGDQRALGALGYVLNNGKPDPASSWRIMDAMMRNDAQDALMNSAGGVMRAIDQPGAVFLAGHFGEWLNQDPQRPPRFIEALEKSQAIEGQNISPQDYAQALKDCKTLGIEYPFRYSPSLLKEITANRKDNKPDGRSLALVLVGEDDHNGALQSAGHEVRRLVEGGHYRVMLYEPASDKEWIANYREAALKQKPDLVYLAVHGSADAMHYGEARDWDNPERPHKVDLGDEERLSEQIGGLLNHGAKVVFGSCSTGFGGPEESNVATMFNRIFNEQNPRIWAPQKDILGVVTRLVLDEQGRVSGVDYRLPEESIWRRED